MTLDLKTLFALELVSALVSSAILASAIRRTAPPGIREATMAMVCLATAFTLMLVRDIIPTQIAILAGNPLFWASGILIHRAISRYVGRPRPARWPLAIFALCGTTFLVLVLLEGPFGIRALTSTFLLLTLTIASCIELARHRGLHIEPARRIMFGLLSLTSIGMIARIAVLLPRWSLEARPAVADLQVILAHVPGLLLAQGFGMAFLLMHHERIAARATLNAATDALTGCANRRTLEAQARFELASSAQRSRGCALIVADLDHFKTINDAHGHPVGDAVLVDAAKLFLANVRPGDVVARYGGEEFCILLRDTNLDIAVAAAERLCKVLREFRFEAHGTPIPLRASFGVAASDGGGEDAWESLFRRADAALYRAKDAGRDRVVADG